ncbi:MAG: DUF4962 domain-containing protein, partial [Bacteroidaceae bacterium]
LLGASAQSTIKLTESMLMHEMRATPSPLDKEVISDRSVSFQWPLRTDVNESNKPLNKEKHYLLRYSQNSNFKEGTTLVETRWPFYNPEKPLAIGVWYWQYGYLLNGETQWGSKQQFTVENYPNKFCPPSLKVVLNNLPKSHPRVWITKDEWKAFMEHSTSTIEHQWYLERADKALQTPMKSVKDINTSKASELDNKVKREAFITREGRRIIDREEENTEALIRSYLLSKDRRYADEAIKRVITMADWDKSKNVAGDFNAATLLSLCSMAYDSFYDLLTNAQKKILLEKIKEKGTDMYNLYNNHLENHIADNHVWQMTLRIFTMAAFSVYGELPEANSW